jgi:hypothetical protein
VGLWRGGIDGVYGDARGSADARPALHEALGVGVVARVERAPAGLDRALDAAEEDIGPGEERETAVAVLVRLPSEELDEPPAGVGHVTEASGVVGLVLERLETGLRVRVVIRDTWAAEAPVDAELGEQIDEAGGGHRSAAVVVNGDGVGRDLVEGGDVREELLGERTALALGDHPRDRVAAIEVE